MNNNEYIQEFEKRLRVGEPKRSELIVEIRNHLEELDQKSSVETPLGDPQKLAQKLNRTHIGIFSSPTLLFATPVAIMMLMLALTLVFYHFKLQVQSFGVYTTDGNFISGTVIGFSLTTFIMRALQMFSIYFLPAIFAIIIGSALSKTNYFKKYFFLLIIEIILLSIGLSIIVLKLNIPDLELGLGYTQFGLAFVLGAVGMGLLFAGIMAVWIMFGRILFYPITQTSNRFLRGRATFDLLLYCLIGFIAFIAITIFEDSVTYPFFTVPREALSPEALRAMPYFSFANICLILGVIVLVLYIAQKRLRRYRALIKENKN